MSLIELLEERRSETRIYGVVIGIVTNNRDPDNLGRVKLKFPWLSEEDESGWARIASPMAGNNRGLYMLPEIDDEVLVAFEFGDINLPYVIGSLWNGVDRPPATNDDEENNMRMIRSRSGHKIILYDKQGEEKIEIADVNGENTIVFDTTNKKMSIKSQVEVMISSPDGKVTIDAGEVEIKSRASANIEAAEMELKASGNMTISGATVNIN